MKRLTYLIVPFFLIHCTQPIDADNKKEEKTEQPAENSPSTPSGWETFKNENYSIQYPESWELNADGLMQTNLILFARAESLENEFRENINLLIQDMNGQGVSLQQFSQISVEQIQSMITNADVISSKTKEGKNGTYQEVIFTGDQGIYELKWRQQYWVQDEKAYVLTYTATQETYDEFQKEMRRVMNSFEFD